MRLIDADILPLDIEREDIDNAPAVDAEPVVHAHWETAGFQDTIWTATCSHCGNYSTVEHDYKGKPMYYKRCPHCGAKMDEEAQNG